MPSYREKSDPFLQTSIVSSKSWEKTSAIEAFWSLSRTSIRGLRISNQQEPLPDQPGNFIRHRLFAMMHYFKEVSISLEEEIAMQHRIHENMEVIGADGVHIGTVDRLEGNRIKLKKTDNSPGHRDHHHYIELGFVADIESDVRVRLSANADVAVTLEEEGSGKPVDL